MNYCATHNQWYQNNSWCIYCGNPYIITTSSNTGNTGITFKIKEGGESKNG